MNERERKRKARYDAWYASLLQEERALWDSIPDLEMKWTPEDQKSWEEEWKNMPTLEEIMAINEKTKPPVKGQKRRKKRWIQKTYLTKREG
jgi:hypothetical protein